MSARPAPERIRTAHAAAILGVEPRTVQALADRGQIPGAALIGSTYTYCEATLRRFSAEFEARKEGLLDSLKPKRVDTIYVVRCGYRVKIGFTANLNQRMHSLSTANHRPIELLASWPGNKADEKAIHARFSDIRVRGEWFALQKPIKEWLRDDHGVMVR
jgi:hypothetical protein